MHRKLPLVFIAVLTFVCAGAQQLPLFTQYMFDPYLINPSMVGSSGRAELNALYRRQWTQIKDGPKTVQFDAQLPLNSKMALGVNIYNDQSVLLNATSVLFTYGYKVLLARDHVLGFGLSAGVFSNRVNLNGVPASDQNDPILLSSSLNNTAMNGQFGAHYRFKNFTLGYSLVNLVDRSTLYKDSFQKMKFGELKNQIFFASYRFTIVQDKWFLQPNVAWRQSQDNLSYYEASAIVSYNNIIDLGGGYRQNFGPSAMVRLNVNQLQVGFAYDFPANQAQVSTGGTQEVQVKWRFGRSVEPLAKTKKKTPDTQPLVITPVENNPPVEEKKVTEAVAETTAPAEIPQTPTTNPKVAEVAEVTPEVSPTAVTGKVIVPGKPEEVKFEKAPEVKSESTDNRYYFVIGTFESEANAKRFYELSRKKGVVTEILESGPGVSPHYYYVHIPAHKADDITLEKLLELQKSTGYKEAWFTKIK